MSKPGLKAHHRIITDNCRARGKEVAIDEALETIKSEYARLSEIWDAESGHKFHVMLTIERND